MFYKRNRGKLIKELQEIDPIDNPNQYKKQYKKLYQLYKYYKSKKYNDSAIVEKLDTYLKQKQLKTFTEIIEEEKQQEQRLLKLEKDLGDLKAFCILQCKKSENMVNAMTAKFKLMDKMLMANKKKRANTIVS